MLGVGREEGVGGWSALPVGCFPFKGALPLGLQAFVGASAVLALTPFFLWTSSQPLCSLRPPFLGLGPDLATACPGAPALLCQPQPSQLWSSSRP